MANTSDSAAFYKCSYLSFRALSVGVSMMVFPSPLRHFLVNSFVPRRCFEVRIVAIIEIYLLIFNVFGGDKRYTKGITLPPVCSKAQGVCNMYWECKLVPGNFFPIMPLSKYFQYLRFAVGRFLTRRIFQATKDDLCVSSYHSSSGY